MLGDECMIAPVYTQNADGRVVYLPERMMFVKFLPDGSLYTEIMEKGLHYVEVALNEVPLFIRENCCIPLAYAAETVETLDTKHLSTVGFDGASFTVYDDDGFGMEYEDPGHYTTIK